MKRTRIFTITAMLAIFALVAAACSSDEDADTTTTTVTTVAAEEMGTIVDVAAGAGTFERLLAAATAAGLADTLAGDGPYTVFAPTDEAFAALPEGTLEALLGDTDALRNILLYHVIPGNQKASDLIRQRRVETLQGNDVKIRHYWRRVFVNRAKVVDTNLMAPNGVVHAINRVLIP